jgi:hypothetical protein
LEYGHLQGLPCLHSSPGPSGEGRMHFLRGTGSGPAILNLRRQVSSSIHYLEMFLNGKADRQSTPQGHIAAPLSPHMLGV